MPCVTSICSVKAAKDNASLSSQTGAGRPQPTPFPGSAAQYTHLQTPADCSEQRVWTRGSPEAPSYLSCSMIPATRISQCCFLIKMPRNHYFEKFLSKWRRSWREGRCECPNRASYKRETKSEREELESSTSIQQRRKLKPLFSSSQIFRERTGQDSHCD